jgi:hypothetical protein
LDWESVCALITFSLKGRFSQIAGEEVLAILGQYGASVIGNAGGRMDGLKNRGQYRWGQNRLP